MGIYYMILFYIYWTATSRILWLAWSTESCSPDLILSELLLQVISQLYFCLTFFFFWDVLSSTIVWFDATPTVRRRLPANTRFGFWLLAWLLVPWHLIPMLFILLLLPCLCIIKSRGVIMIDSVYITDKLPVKIHVSPICPAKRRKREI